MQYALTLPLSPPPCGEEILTVLQSSEKRYSFSQASDAGQGNTKILFLHLWLPRYSHTFEDIHWPVVFENLHLFLIPH